MSQKASQRSVRVTVRNIGGIAEHNAELVDGVNVLTGPNATNRTSLLKALAAAQGSTDVRLKGDKTEGFVELSYEGQGYTRRIRQVDDSLVFEGDHPIPETDVDAAERFAFLFEQNRTRQAVRQNADLRDVVMEPVDTEQIQRDIATLKEKRSECQKEIEEIESLQSKLPSVKERRAELESEIDRLETDIAEKEAEIEAAEGSVVESKESKQAIEEKVRTLRSHQSTLESTESKIQTNEETVNELESELEKKRAELESLEPVDESRLHEIDSRLSDLHDQVAEKERMMSELQNIIKFNEEYVTTDSGDGSYPNALSADGRTSGTKTDQLADADERIVCWTCGSETSRDRLGETIDRLRALHEDLHGERTALQSEIDESQAEKDELVRRQEQRNNLEQDIRDLESQLEQYRTNLKQLREKRKTTEDAIATAEEELEALRDDREETILTLHQELNTLEFELEEATDELESVTTEIEEIEAEVAGLDELRDEIESKTAELEELRQRVDNIERDIVDRFNQHMEIILEKLSYKNIERIWLERQQVQSRDGRRKVEQTRFSLNVVREGDDGSAYQDTVEHLSESEREVTGLIFALAGYHVHDVHETVPFMLLDSLEAIDSDRIATLIEYIESYADNIVVALLEEDAGALPEKYTRHTELTA